MKMTEPKPMKLKALASLGRCKSRTSQIDEMLEESENDRMAEEAQQELRIKRFIKLHGGKKWRLHSEAQNCLKRALSREREEDWRNFISVLGHFTGDDLQECISLAKYGSQTEFPWQVALNKIDPTLKNIINTANFLKLSKVCADLLDVFHVPDSDDVEDSSPESDTDENDAGSMTSMANGKEPEENDDHNNSELSASPNDEASWSGACAAPMKKEECSPYNDFNAFPSYKTKSENETNGSSTFELERGPKVINSVASLPAEEFLWKLTPGQQADNQPVTNSIFYSEGTEAPPLARPHNNPFVQPPVPNCNVATNVASVSPPPMVYSGSGSFLSIQPNIPVVYVMQAPYMSLPTQFPGYPFQQTQPVCTTTHSMAYGNPTNSFVQAPAQQFHLPSNSATSPGLQPSSFNNVNVTHDYNATSAYPYSVNTATFLSSAANGSSPTRNSTNPFLADLNVQNSPLNGNCMSLPVNNFAARVSAPLTPPLSARVPNASRPSVSRPSGATSLPNMNQNTMAVFLTHSNDATREAHEIKCKLKRSFPGIRVITHDVMSRTDNFIVPEKIDKIFRAMDFIIPIISPQYLKDVSAEVAASNPEAAAIRTMYVRYLDNFHFDGCKNLKVRALRLPSVTYEEVKKLPTCLSTARIDVDQLVNVLHYARTRTPGLTVS